MHQDIDQGDLERLLEAHLRTFHSTYGRHARAFMDAGFQTPEELATVTEADVPANLKGAVRVITRRSAQAGAAAAGALPRPETQAEQYARAVEAAGPPSQYNADVLQNNPTPLFKTWRPAAGLCPQLAHPGFGRFVEIFHDMGNTCVTPEVERVVVKLCTAAQALAYNTPESQLEPLFVELLSPLLTGIVTKLAPVPGSNIQTDGAIVLRGPSGLAVALVLVQEVKRDIGKASSEPSLQGAGYQARFWLCRLDSAVMQFTCCPAFLVEFVGPHMRISALFFHDVVTMVHLTPLLHLLPVFHDPAHLLTLGRALGALQQCQRELCGWYSTEVPALVARQNGMPQARMQLGGRAPYVLDSLPYPLHEGYTAVQRMAAGRLIYSATRVPSGQEVVVKFCLQYGAAVHEQWAAAGLAPRLISSTHLPGGYTMLEMDVLRSADGWGTLQAVLSTAADPGARSALCTAVEQALGVAHALPGQGVHGDMRPPNILVRSAGGSWQVMFVDFEFAGQQGVAKYPRFLHSTIPWPGGVQAGQPVWQEHDRQLLRNTLSNLLTQLWG